MGGVHPGCLSKEQLFHDLAQDVSEAAHEWLGKGALTTARLTQEGQVRLPASLQDFQTSNLRICSRLARLPQTDELSDPRSPSRGSREATGPFQVHFAEDDADCRSFEALLSEGNDFVASAEFSGVARAEQEARNMAKLLIGFAPNRNSFVLSLRVELASIAFKKLYSPFRNPAYVESAVKQLTDLSSQQELLKFASTYGNCIVEKAFFGGVLCLCFKKGRGEGFEVELGRDIFTVTWQHRGGSPLKVDAKKAMSCEQLEKLLRSWAKSCGAFKAKGKAVVVVRLQLAPTSKVEGLAIPDELLQMDLERKSDLETASAELKRAERARNLPKLCEALDKAFACHLDDPLLEELQERRLKLVDAEESLERAKADVNRLGPALKDASEVGLQEWSREKFEEMTRLHRRLLEQRQRSRLEAALSGDVSLGDSVDILRGAVQDDCSHLNEFDAVESKVSTLISTLTRAATSDELSEDLAVEQVDALRELPEAAAKAVGARAQFREAVTQLQRRSNDKKLLEKKRHEMEQSLQQLLTWAEDTSGDETVYQELQQRISEVSELPVEMQRSLDALKTRGEAVLHEKRSMDETAQQVQQKLRAATLAESCEPEMLEAALQDVAVKQRSGALHRAPLSSQLLSSARKQLQALLQQELEEHLRKACAPGAIQSGGSEAMAEAKRVMKRMEDACGPSCAEECQQARLELQSVEKRFEEQLLQQKKQVDAKEKLKHSHGSGDPDCLEGALQEAQDHGLEDEHLMPAQARLRELRTAERQVQKAIETGDRVHLTTALEEAGRQGLKTPVVDEAQQKLQSSKTGKLISAIRERDYHGLHHAIAEAESRHPEEVAEVADVLSQAKEVHQTLDSVAKGVSVALRSMKFEDLQSSVAEAAEHNIVTEDVKKAEGMVATMNEALGKLQVASNSGDLAALQESLHATRQLGLQDHDVYIQSAEQFSATCMPSDVQWALEEQRGMWLVLCLRRPMTGVGQSVPSHPFAECTAELCHAAQISPEAEPYAVQYINYVLIRMVNERTSADQIPELLRAALEDLAADKINVLEKPISAKQFNEVGIATKEVKLSSCSVLLWWLVCIIEWQSGHRIFLSFMSELIRRTADLLNEADSTCRSLKTHITALQAQMVPKDDEVGVPEVAPETLSRTPPVGLAVITSAAAADARIAATKGVLEEIGQVKKEAEKLQANLLKNKISSPDTIEADAQGFPDFKRILELLQKAQPKTLESAKSAAKCGSLGGGAAGAGGSSGRAREIYGETYGALETKLLQLQLKGRQALDGELGGLDSSPKAAPSSKAAALVDVQLPFATYSEHLETVGSVQDHAFLELLGIPEGNMPTSQAVDRCFLKVEVYDRFSEKTGAVEDEFERFCRAAVNEARQRCGGRRLVAALKPLLVDLVKRRQGISSMLNTLRSCGLDKVEKNLLRKHLQPRDVLIALTFSSMPPGTSQARMMTLAAKTDSPLPLLFGWAVHRQGRGLQLASQIQWGALRELFCSPSYPLVLSVGTETTLGKSYLLQYLYALQECHFRGQQNPLRIHSMPSIDIIGDFAREECMRGVTLADVHSFSFSDSLCQALTATLQSFASVTLLHASLKTEFDSDGRPKENLQQLLSVLSAAENSSFSLLLLLRDADDDHGPSEQRRVMACVRNVAKSLRPEVLKTSVAWLVTPLASLGPTELTNEVKSLRKSRGISLATSQEGSLSLEEALAVAPKSTKKFPPMPVLQQSYLQFAELFAGRNMKAQGKAHGALAQRVLSELDPGASCEGLLGKLFPVAQGHQQLTVLIQEKVRCLGRGREYLEPEERRLLESNVDSIDREIGRLRSERQRAPPHPLLRTFAHLVLTGDISLIVEFGACLNEWKQSKRAPLLERKLQMRKELDRLTEISRDKKNEASEMTQLRTELATLQKRLDEVDVSTDSFWLELMLWHELERTGVRLGLKEIDDRLTFSAAKACYLNWVKSGNPLHFLHSAPLQFGAFEPLRWHPQLSGASFFGSDFIGDVLRELDRDLGVDVRRRPLLVISVIGVQSSGKSTLMNYLFGCSFATHVGRCTKGLYISLLETRHALLVILDTEGLLSVEARDDVFDKQVALMTMACSDLVIVNNRGELGRHVGDLFQVCLFALYHLKLARISPAIGFVLQCLSMVNQQQQYEWVATVKRSLEDSVQELQQKETKHSFKLQDLVFLDSESIFVMPSAFNDDVQFGLQVSRPTNLYALKALQLREKVFQWIARAKASQKYRFDGDADSTPSSSGSVFASLSQWYEHARTVWQTLSMCGTDLLQFRTMRQVLMAQQLQEFCDALVQKHVDGKMNQESEHLIQRYTKELRLATGSSEVHGSDNAFRGQLDALRDAVLQEMQHDFDEFVRSHDSKFTDEQVKSDKRFSLMGPMRRKYASVDSLWRSAVHLVLEQNSMDHLFEEISARVNDLLLDQGSHINVQNVERVFEEKWSQVMAEALRKQRPSLERVIQEVVSHFNAALLNLKSQFRKAHIFHGVKTLTSDLREMSEVSSSFLLAKKGIGAALVPLMPSQGSQGSATTQVDNLWIKLVDTMRLEVDQQGQMSDAAALKILNRLNTEMEAADQLRQLLHRLGSPFVQKLVYEMAKATIHYRFQIEQQNFQSRVNEIMSKKKQKLWEIQARVDSGKREVHCAKVWAKTFVDTLDQHFRNAVGRMAQEVVSHMSKILTNPGSACEQAIERSFTRRNWRHVVMYAIDPTQYLFMEFHKEWESFKQGLVDKYCQELKNNFGSCLRVAEERMQDLLQDHTLESVADLTMNKLSQVLKEACSQLADDSLSSVLCSCLPSFQSDADWTLNNFTQFVRFCSVELQRYRSNMRQTELTVERRMEGELTRQKSDFWKCISGCPARCPGCGTKCNLESENHWPDRPHECRRHVYPAFNGWQKQEGRKPFLLHCRASAQWRIARTRPPIEAGGPERYWDNFQAMLEDEHPDWLDPISHCPLATMEPLEDYEEDCENAPEEIQKEIDENRRAWANCKDALLEHFTSMADDPDIPWLEKYKREGGALKREDFVSIRDELFAVTPLESLDAMDSMMPEMPDGLDDTLDESVY